MARHRFAVIFLAAVALCSSFWLLLDLVAFARAKQTFGVPAFESRFDGIRRALPPRSVLGYTSDNPGNDPSTPLEFYLTQYTLAPAIVKPTTDEHLVVVNFHDPKPDPKLLAARNLTPVQNYGNGVWLCRNNNR